MFLRRVEAGQYDDCGRTDLSRTRIRTTESQSRRTAYLLPCRPTELCPKQIGTTAGQHGSETSRKIGDSRFLAATTNLTLGWILLHFHLETFFDPGDFAAVNVPWHLWVGMYRFDIFGYVISVMALT